MAQLNEEFPPASLTFYIDCPVETCLRRIEQRQFILSDQNVRAPGKKIQAALDLPPALPTLSRHT